MGSRGKPLGTAKRRRRRRTRKWSAPPWLVSSLLHVAMLLIAMFWSLKLAAPERPVLEMALLDTSVQLPQELPAVDVAAEPLPSSKEPAFETEESLAALSSDERLEPDTVSLASATVNITSPSTDMLIPSASDLLRPAPGGGGAPGSGRGGRRAGKGRGTAQFFGASSTADRVVFLVDNSNSMVGGRFETALMELDRSVQQLSPKQSFYVVFYSDAAYRMFHPQAVDDLVPATPENKRLLSQWLQSVEMCTGGRLIDAVDMATELKPDAVFLLSDGVIGEYPTEYLTSQGNRSFTLHTLGMTVPNQEAAGKLEAIAEAHGGTFRPVGIAPPAREMARRRLVKKNRTRGPVWGTNLPAHQ